jgi:hypothetical protein
MRTHDGGHRASAVTALARREYQRAGDAYARAGRRVLADPRDGVDPFDPDERGWVGDGLAHLVTSAVCYRVAERPDRATHRGVEAEAAARDLRTVVDHPARRACLLELAADARVAGDLDEPADTYERAREAYDASADAVADAQTLATRPLFQAGLGVLQQVARGGADGEIAVTWADIHGSDPADSGAFLARRARYKHQRFPAAVERAVAAGHLAAPRGTTEYDTDHHECPHCGSRDVNWVADSTLCLRCSRPTDPV